eukprot:362555-Chlamydomonas_euryale.AAC.7
MKTSLPRRSPAVSSPSRPPSSWSCSSFRSWVGRADGMRGLGEDAGQPVEGRYARGRDACRWRMFTRQPPFLGFAKAR